MKRLLAVLVSLSLFCSGKEVFPQESNKVKAKKHFDRAVKYFNEGQYEDALIGFEASYDYRPHWKIKYNIAVCHFHLEHYIEAAKILTEFLKEGKEEVPENQMKHASEIFSELKTKLGILRLTGDTENVVLEIDGEVRENVTEEQDLFLDPGKHRIYILAGGTVIIDEELEFKPGFIREISTTPTTSEEKKVKEIIIEKTVEVEEEPREGRVEAGKASVPEKKSKLKAGAWASLAVGAAFLAAGGAMVGLAAREKMLMEDAEKEYLELFGDPGVTDERLEAIESRRDDHYHKARKMFPSGSAMLAVGGAVVVTSIVLFVTASKNKGEIHPAGKRGMVLNPWPAYLQITF